MPLPHQTFDTSEGCPIEGDLIERALDEDLDKAGDITSQAIFPASQSITAKLVTRQAGMLAGIGYLKAIAAAFQADIDITPARLDGDDIKAGDQLAMLEGNARDVLKLERTALNFIQHLCGIASLTALYVEKTKGTNTKICCTRKTIPGYRRLAKYAVRMGGGVNHRRGLYDGVLIKDNHIAAAGDIETALRAANAKHARNDIEIEVDSLSQLEEVLRLDIAALVLLDNMSLSDLSVAATMAQGKVFLEASGGVTLENVQDIAKTGVDFISVGRLTHSAPALDLGLDFI